MFYATTRGDLKRIEEIANRLLREPQLEPWEAQLFSLTLKDLVAIVLDCPLKQATVADMSAPPPKAAKNPSPEDLRRWAEEDRIFAERVVSGAWPINTCEDCVVGSCCKRTWHHVGGLCLHCGMDERNLNNVKGIG